MEHEYILIFRKGDKRPYRTACEKKERMRSSFFWEERNVWFSDLWDLKGVKQIISKTASRERSASFPLEIPYRLINMYSQMGDVVLDPFMGLGTTAFAAIITERNSIGYEIDALLSEIIIDNISNLNIHDINKSIENRINNHRAFVDSRLSDGKEVKHFDDNLDTKVMTKQESEIILHFLNNTVVKSKNPVCIETEFFDESCVQRPLSLF